MALHLFLPVSRWEYQVIHLNVEDSSTANQAPAQQGPASAPEQPPAPPEPNPPLAGQPVFSKAYLEQEFPDFYSNPPVQPQHPPQAQQQPNHPALQLQQFLNGHGQQGWSLVGIYPLGSLLMMFFRRRIPDPPAPPIPASAPTAQQPYPAPAVAPQAPAAPMAQPADGAATPGQSGVAETEAPPVTDWLQQIMQRLESLEGRIASPGPLQAGPESSPPVAPAAAAPVEPVRQRAVVPGERRLRRRSSASQPVNTSAASANPLSGSSQSGVTASGPEAGSGAAASGEALILSANLLASLEGEVGMPTFHAAKALDFRSYATLAGFGSRHGYPLGLVKQGAHQMAAVYVGLEQGDRGGRAKRLWVVVPVERLRGMDIA